MREFYLCYPAILTNTLVPQPGLSSILQNQLGVALDALTGTKNNVLVTKPSERFQDTRVILIFLVKFEKRRVKTLRQDASPERRRD